MDVFEAIRTILAVRKFQDRPVPGRADPPRRRGRQADLQLAERPALAVHRDPGPGDAEEDRRASDVRPYTSDAAFAVAVAYEKESPFGVSDASLAIHSMMLTAWAEGVGSNWVGFANRYGETIAPLLGLPDATISWRSSRSATGPGAGQGEEAAQGARRGSPPRAVRTAVRVRRPVRDLLYSNAELMEEGTGGSGAA